ncbi:MAG: hypothetical protein AAGG48_10470 [Planctomycetota bacterium]
MSTSPFEIFRRNLKPLMVALTGLALFAFVVLPVLDSAMRRDAGSGTDGVVASFGSTDLNRARVENFTRNHNSTVNFLLDLAQQTIDRGGSPKTAGFSYDAQAGQIRQLGINQDPSFNGTIRSFMLANEAKKLGFELDDSSLQVWLSGFTDGLFSNGEIDSMLMQATQNQMGRPHLYEQLRTHLLANIFLTRGFSGLSQGSGQFSRPLMTPEEEWTNFLKLSRNAVVTAYGIDVNDYMERTNSSPSEEEVSAVYEEGKDRFPSPLSPEPGFRVPYKASFEYVVANVDKFIDEEVAKLDEADIRAEYAKRLAGGDFQLPSTGIPESTPEDSTENPEGDSMPEENGEGEGDETTDPPADGSSEDAAGESSEEESANEKNAEGGQPKTNSENTESENAGSNESTESDPAGEAESTESGEGPSGDDQSSIQNSNAVRLVIAQEAENESGEPQESTEEEATEPETKEEASTEEPTTTPESSEDASTEEPTQEGEAETEAEGSQDPESPASDTVEEKPEEPEDELRVETYEEVRDEIAREMATPAAEGRINIALSDLMNQMTKYGKRVRIATADEETKKPDIKALAEQYGLDYEKIGPYDQRTITEDQEPIAESSEPDMTGMGTTFLMTMYGFNNGQFSQAPERLFAPVRTVDPGRNRQYVSWKIEEAEAYVPTEEEARSEIVFAIRQREARKFAEEAAEAIAKQIREGKPLAEIVPADRKDQIIDATEPFSWMRSFGFQGAFLNDVTYRVGEDTESLGLGEDFMEDVFASKTNDVIVAGNNAKSTYYVVQPTRFEPAIEELRRRFNQGRLMTMFMSNGGEAVIADFYKTTDENADFVNYVEGELE